MADVSLSFKIIIISLASLFLTLPLFAFAQNVPFVPLVDVPFLNPQGGNYSNATLSDYIQAFYLIAITVAAFLAVVKIIFGGIKYMLSDVVTDKGEAKKDIRGALLGLLIVLAAVLILNTIWSGFTDFNIFKNPLATINYTNSTGFICQFYPGRPDCQAPPAYRYTGPGSCPTGSTLTMNRVDDTTGTTFVRNCVSDGSTTVNTGNYSDPNETDPNQLQFDCEQAGYNWVNGVCRTTGTTYIPFPASAFTESEKRMFCSGNNLPYSVNGCVQNN